MAAVHFIRMIRSFVMLCFLMHRNNAKKLRKNINLLFIATVTMFEIVWLIYGNTFHYNQESMRCKERENVKPLWILMMIEMIIGYIMYLSCGLIVGSLTLYFWVRGIRERREGRRIMRAMALARHR